jgi:hypothetical protein
VQSTSVSSSAYTTRERRRYGATTPHPRHGWSRALSVHGSQSDRERESNDYLATRTLTFSQPRDESRLVYDSQIDRGATFEIGFDSATELKGNMKWALFVSTDQGDALDLLVGIEKVDVHGEVVNFEGRQ